MSKGKDRKEINIAMSVTGLEHRPEGTYVEGMIGADATQEDTKKALRDVFGDKIQFESDEPSSKNSSVGYSKRFSDKLGAMIERSRKSKTTPDNN